MKRKYAPVVTALAAAIVLSAPVQAATDPLSVVKDYMAAWSALSKSQKTTDQDVFKASNIVASYYDADVEYLDASVGTPQVGSTVARDKVVRPFLTAIPNAKWEMVGEPKINGNDVEFKWKFSGNARGPYLMDPSCKGQGEAINLPGEAKITVKDGLITYQNDKYDDKLLAKQLEKSDKACKAQKAKEAAAAK